jgi:16S rRNA (uracil1498-N3)-methyltransferase
MSQHRFFCEKIIEPITELVGTEFHHLNRVLRLSKGQEVELFDGNGIIATATIKEVHTGKAALQINETKIYNPPTDSRIILAVSVAKGDRFNWLVEKCTELGADRITPVIFDRTIKQAANPKVGQRWKNIAISAAKQCKRVFLPCIDGPLVFPEAAEMLVKQYCNAKILFGSPDERDTSISDCYNGTDDIIAFVGPEGGITDEERMVLISNDAIAVRLTDTILRTETAAVSFCSILTTLRDRGKK